MMNRAAQGELKQRAVSQSAPRNGVLGFEAPAFINESPCPGPPFLISTRHTEGSADMVISTSYGASYYVQCAMGQKQQQQQQTDYLVCSKS
jgi:hypothetical protein